MPEPTPQSSDSPGHAVCVLFASSPSVGAESVYRRDNDADFHTRSDSRDRPPGVRHGCHREAKGGCCGGGTSCCGPTGSSSTRLGYSDADLAAVPDGADLGLGCGNPQAIAGLAPGERVLDLGSGEASMRSSPRARSVLPGESSAWT